MNECTQFRIIVVTDPPTHTHPRVRFAGGWGFNPPNDFFDPRVSVDLSSWGVDGAENVAFLMIFPSATAAL